MTQTLWLAFLGLVGTLIVLDLGLLSRKPRAVSPREGLTSMGLWLLASVAFSFLVAYVYQHNWLKLEDEFSFPLDKQGLNGEQAWLQFFTSYVLELALNLDNLFILALLFAHFRIPRPLLARTLFWSILAFLATRFGFIMGGAALIRTYAWMPWVLGGVLVAAMLRVLVLPDERTDFSRSWAVRIVRRLVRVSVRHDGHRLITRVEERGVQRLAATPMLAAVLAAALMDIWSSADSVPALFSVTKDPFLAFTASAFAALGLRSAYFAFSNVIGRFRYLKISLVFVLLWVAAKMFMVDYQQVPTQVTLGIVALVMAIGVGASVMRNRRLLAAHPEQVTPTPLEDLTEAVEATRRNLRKVMILIAGTTVILVGIIIAPLPGPGPTVLIPIGLALLATEFVWARRLLEMLKNGAFNVADRADVVVDRVGVWVIPVGAVLWWTIGPALVYGGAWALNRLWHTDLHVHWYTIAVIVGSPFMPCVAWGVNYIRKWIKRRRGGDARSASDQRDEAPGTFVKQESPGGPDDGPQQGRPAA